MADMRAEMRAITSRLSRVEDRKMAISEATQDHAYRLDSHSEIIRDLYRRVEDLDNRGRRHNIRVRGLTESTPPGQLEATVVSIFNDLLERPPDSPLSLERCHRALRPQGPPSAPPRDVITYVTSFQLKEAILRKARDREMIQHGENTIQLYRDLSPITLQQRRALRPLLEVLRTRGIAYSWSFPFALAATVDDRTVTLQSPADMDKFCDALRIPYVETPEWNPGIRAARLVIHKGAEAHLPGARDPDPEIGRPGGTNNNTEDPVTGSQRMWWIVEGPRETQNRTYLPETHPSATCDAGSTPKAHWTYNHPQGNFRFAFMDMSYCS